MVRKPSPESPCGHPPGTIPATAFDQLNYACTAFTDQLLHVVISFDGQIRETCLMSALRGAIRANPVLGCRFCGTEHPWWEPAPISTYAGLLRVHETGDPELRLRQVLVIPVDASRTPPIRLDLIQSGTDTLCITLHHAAGDARAILDCARLIAQLYRDSGSTGVIAAGPGRGGQDRGNGRYLSLLPPQATVPPDFGAPSLPPPDFFPFRSGSCDARDFAIRTLPPAYLEQARAFAKARSVTTGAVLLAATALAFRRFRPQASAGMLPILHSLDLRRHYPGPGPGCGPVPGGEPACDIANRSVPFEVLLSCDDSQTLDRLVVPAAEALRRFRTSDGPLLEVLKAEDLAGRGFGAVRDHVDRVRDTYLRHGTGCPFLVNAGIVPEECLDFGRELRVTGAFVAAGIATEPPGIVVTASTSRSRLTLTFGFCSAGVSRDSAEALLDAIVASLPGPGC